jgi:hypothetical protein
VNFLILCFWLFFGFVWFLFAAGCGGGLFGFTSILKSMLGLEHWLTTTFLLAKVLSVKKAF